MIVVAPTSTATGSIQFTEDIAFTITSTGFAQVFVFEDWVASDGTPSTSLMLPEVYYSLNGGAPFQIATTLYDNLAATDGDMSANDGYLFHNAIAVQVGDILTIKQGSYTLKQAMDFNPAVTQTFTGSMFVANPDGIAISNTVPVPEPAPLALVLMSSALGGWARARKVRSVCATVQRC